MTEPLSPELLAAAYTTRQLAELHRVAQEKLGLAAGLVAFTAFEEVNFLNPTMSAEWYARIVSVTVAIRKMSRRLAARYYNLARAIEIGSAYPDIDGAHGPGTVQMAVLFQEMGEVLNEVINLTTPETDVPASSDLDSDVEKPPGDRIDEIDQIIEDIFTDMIPDEDSAEWLEEIDIEDFEWPEDESDSEDFLDELEQLVAEEVAKFTVSSKGVVEDKDTRTPERLREVLDLHAEATASVVDSAVMAQGRSFESDVRVKDGRVRGWYRATGPNPCAFCAMLASRGAVYYTKESAGGTKATEYHPNCHCRAIQIWLNRPWYTERDIYFIRSWKKVTDGLNKTFGDHETSEAFKAWRSWYERQKRLGKVPEQDFGRRPE